LPVSERAKIALFCNVPASAVIPALDAKSIYAVPLQYHAEGLDSEVLRAFGVEPGAAPDLSRWTEIVDRLTNPEGEVTIGVVGKYVGLQDAYKSLNEALVHGGIANRVKVNVRWIDAELFEGDDDGEIAAQLEPCHAILVPGAFGERGAEGKIKSVRFAREHRVPYFGICFGMQMACIEGARDLAGIDAASSTEFGPTPEPVVGLITEWMGRDGLEKREEQGDLGGTMRLGAYEARLDGNSVVSSIYGGTSISERHRHRYEVNTNYKERLEQGGLVFSGMSPDGTLPEIVERPDHPWFVGVQFHPELKSKPFDPHPLFASFIQAAVRQSRLV
jgi:CTP synthase